MFGATAGNRGIQGITLYLPVPPQPSHTYALINLHCGAVIALWLFDVYSDNISFSVLFYNVKNFGENVSRMVSLIIFID